MKNLGFDADAFEDLAWWVEKDRATALKIITLIREVQREPFSGTGKPEKLKHDLAGCWSRRINETDQNFVYGASGTSKISTSELNLHKKLNTLDGSTVTRLFFAFEP